MLTSLFISICREYFFPILSFLASVNVLLSGGSLAESTYLGPAVFIHSATSRLLIGALLQFTFKVTLEIYFI